MAAAAKGKVKAKAHENLTEANIKKVIGLLEAEEKPISKAEACEILNIAKNYPRLAKIIDNYKAEQEELARRRAANRGKPATPYEIQTIIENFLDGDAITEIAKRIFRSAAFVKDVIDTIGVPQKNAKSTYWVPALIPDQCLRESYTPGEIVWNSKRNAMCIIREEKQASDPTNKYYQVYVIEPIEEVSPYFGLEGYGGHYDGAYAYDLAALDHLKQYGVDIYRPYKPYFKNWLEGK